jgi:hypothetical protein
MAVLQAPQQKTATQHCPAGYDAFGPYTVPWGGKVDEIYGNMRAFIWLHWHEHRPACAAITYTEIIEDVTCTEAYTIEAGKEGRWHIDGGFKCGPGGKGYPRPASMTSTWYDVRRVRQSPQAEPVPDSAELPGQSYFLKLRDLSGRKEGTL